MNAEPGTAHACNERRRLKRFYPDAYKDGLLVGSGVKQGPRESGGYPRRFAAWPLERSNAWFVGFNVGYCDRKRGEVAGDG